MSPTLTLTLPIILLGRHSILNPLASTTSPLPLILQTFQHFCTTSSFHPDTSPTQPPHSTEPSRPALGAVQTGKWLLRAAPYTAPSTRVFDQTKGWREGDACLTAHEKMMLDESIWSCSFLLVRRFIPTDTTDPGWDAFVAETHEVCRVLKTAFVDLEGAISGIEGAVKIWDLVSGERCFLRVDVGPVDGEVAKGVVMIMAAFEREWDLLRSTGEVVKFVGVSRWLEGVLLRTVAEEKREAARKSGGSGCGEGMKGWKSSVGAEEERCRREKGREREWWDVIHDMDEKDMLKHMRRFEERGLRLGVSIQSKERNDRVGDVDEDGNACITVQGQRSTLDAGFLVAYTGFIPHLVEAASRSDIDELASQLEDLQQSHPSRLSGRFANMLDFLVRGANTALLAALTSHLNPATRSNTHLTRPQSDVDPFFGLRTHLEMVYARSRKDMEHFIERYGMAGGYMPTTEEKLLALLEAEEERRRQV